VKVFSFGNFLKNQVTIVPVGFESIINV